MQALSTVAHNEQEDLRLLTSIALCAFRTQQYKESADLLRATEHLAFASLHAGSVDTVADDLRQVIRDEFERLIERAQEHSQTDAMPDGVREIYLRSLGAAQSCLQSGSLRAALEFARGAEALAHVRGLDQRSLVSPAAPKQLQPS